MVWLLVGWLLGWCLGFAGYVVLIAEFVCLVLLVGGVNSVVLRVSWFLFLGILWVVICCLFFDLLFLLRVSFGYE